MKLDGLQAVNAFFGFCVPSDGTWPQPLHDMGYAVLAIEREISARINGTVETKVVDFACAAESPGHILCIEAKSRSIDERQAAAYAAVSTKDFVEQLWYPQPAGSPGLNHDFGYVTGSDDQEHVIIGLAKVGVELPVLSCDGTRFDLEDGSFQSAAVHALFAEGVPLGRDHVWPRHFVKFTSFSTDGEMVAPLMAAVASRLIAAKRFSIEEICSASISHWEFCGQGEQHRFRHRFAKLIDRAAREELNPFMARDGMLQAWVPHRERLDMPQQSVSLQRRAQDFVDRIKLGGDFNDQLHLFDPPEDPF
jgi:hypothetical protein